MKDTSAEDNFAMMFTSLNLILLSFFILLNSIAVRDSERERKALGSLRGSFGILLGGENPIEEGKSLQRSDIVGGKSRSQALMSQTQSILRRAGLFVGESRTKVVQTADGLRVEFSDKVLFKPGRTELDPRTFQTLDKLAALFVKVGRPLVVRGYADPARPANYPSNLELSASRATQVARYLVEAAGVKPELVRAEGMGVRDRQVASQRFVELFVPSSSLSVPLEQGVRR